MAKRHRARSVDRPQRIGKHVAETIKFIRASGGTDITVRNDRHVRISFDYGGKPCWFMLSSTPRDVGGCAEIARSLVRRAIRQAEAS